MTVCLSVLSVCLSVCLSTIRRYAKLESRWTDFREIFYCDCYLNLSRECKFGPISHRHFVTNTSAQVRYFDSEPVFSVTFTKRQRKGSHENSKFCCRNILAENRRSIVDKLLGCKDYLLGGVNLEEHISNTRFSVFFLKQFSNLRSTKINITKA